MRMALIGYTGHFGEYARMLRDLPEATVAAVAAASPEERLAGFDRAPGVSPETRRYDNPERLLDAERLDFVQVCCRPDRIAPLTIAALTRGVPVVAEKPLAMDLETLAQVHEASVAHRAPVMPMHTYRSNPYIAAARQAVRRGEVGVPFLGFSQKSYRWGERRPDYFKSRATFPGTGAFIGIHAFDWLLWTLGDCFTAVSGVEGNLRSDYPAAASHAAYLLKMQNGGICTVTCDYLRPGGAPTHGDDRVRIVGSGGVVEGLAAQRTARLITHAAPPQELPTPEPASWYSSFVRSLRGDAEPVIQQWEAFRVTEIALKAQMAGESGSEISLCDSPYSPKPGQAA